MDFSSYNEELIELRRHFHRYPELGFNEFETQKFIINYLENLGLKPEKIAKTGVVCLIEGRKSEPVVLLRSDMDALPVIEETGLDFESLNFGVMHACGHDGHMAMLLISAKILNENKDYMNCTVKLAFQPNEEDAGAYLMIEEGIMENPTVQKAIGVHLWSPIETGEVGIKSGALMASSYYYKVEVVGSGGHGGSPHEANNPVDTVTLMVNEIYKFQSQTLDVTKPTLITVCKLNAGLDSPIIISEKASFEGSIRCLHDEGDIVREKFKKLLEASGVMKNCKVNVEFFYGNEVIINDADVTKHVESVAIDVVGKNNILSTDIGVMLGDDFSDFSRLVPSCYIFVGVGNEVKKSNYPHHNPKFNIDEDALIRGVEIIVGSVLKF